MDGRNAVCTVSAASCAQSRLAPWLFKGRYSASRVWLTVEDLLLTLAMVAVIVSVLLVSRHAFDFLGLRMRAVGRRIHMPATMWALELFILRESAFLAYEEPLAIFFASYAAILFLWVALAYFLRKLLRKLQSPAQASSAEDFLTAPVQLQEACGVANFKKRDYGMRKEECRTLAVNARETMGGLFLANPCELNDEDCAAIFEKAYR